MLERFLRFVLIVTIIVVVTVAYAMPKVTARPYYYDYKTPTIEEQTSCSQKKIERINDVFEKTHNNRQQNADEEASQTKKDETIEIEQSVIEKVEETIVKENENANEPGSSKQEVADKDPAKESEKEHAQNSTIKFDAVDEYLYVNTSSLNIRTGPGTQYQKVGSFQLNDKVHRVGVGSNGWSKILLNDNELYVYSSYLSKTEVHVETVLEEMNRRGNIGRLRITSVGIDVAIFATSIYDLSHSQPIVDRSDSAAYMQDGCNYYGFILIGDHVHQGFGGIKKSVIGSTIMEIDNGSTIEKYICVDRFIGYNGYKGVGGLYDANGNSVAGRNDGGICLYTCNSDGSITITFWQPI